MDVRMIQQVAPPGVQHGQDGELATHILRVPSQFLQRGRRGLEQQRVENFLMGINQGTQWSRQGEGQKVVSTSQKLLALLFQPALRLRSVTLGTMPVAARVIAVLLVSAVVAI